MTDIEQAAQRLYAARIAKRDAHAALRAYWVENGGCVGTRYYVVGPCYDYGTASLASWCSVCQGSQSLWEARQAASHETGAAMNALMNAVRRNQWQQHKN